jgi:hypothetical protein
MTDRWTVTFLGKDEQPIARHVVEAADVHAARAVALKAYPELASTTTGTLVLEEHEIKPEDAVAVLGNVWDEIRKILAAGPDSAPPWSVLHPEAKAAWVCYLRDYVSETLDAITSAVVEIDAERGRRN